MNGIVWEIGRKIKTKENEEHNSYTKLYGTKKAVWMWIGAITIAFIFALIASLYVGYGWACVDAGGPLWVMREDGQIHADDLKRLEWLRLPVVE